MARPENITEFGTVCEDSLPTRTPDGTGYAYLLGASTSVAGVYKIRGGLYYR